MTLRTTLAWYFFATFLQAGAYGLTFLMPLLFAEFGGNEQDVGAVLAATTISTLVTVLCLGHITARIGRVYALCLAACFIAIALYIFALTDSVGIILYIAGAVLGVGWAIFYVLTPVILTEVTAKDQRIRQFTLLSVFIMAGFGLSPVLGAYLVKSNFGIDVTFYTFAVLCLFSGGIFLLLRAPIARHSLVTTVNDYSQLSAESLSAIMQSKAVRPIVMVGIGSAVFAAVINFQTVYAAQNALDYAEYFLAYTLTVIVCRVLLASFVGGRSPYAIIAVLLFVMTLGIILLHYVGDNPLIYIFAAILFGVGYGVAYPIVKAMASQDTDPRFMSQTMQVFALSYFLGVFGFPFVSGWIIHTSGMELLLWCAAMLGLIECALAAMRAMAQKA